MRVNKWWGLVLLLSGCYGTACPSGDGEKVGVIVKVAHIGYWCPTYEAELVRGGFVGGSGGQSIAPFDFSIRTKTEADSLQHLMESGAEVKVQYQHYGYLGPCLGERSVLLTSVVPRDVANPKP